MITNEPIRPTDLVDASAAGDNGAVVTFAGVVRAANGARRVTHIHYDAYAPMAEREIARVIDEIRGEFAITSARVVHRVGDVRAGEMSLFVVVTAPHRGPAFGAIERLVAETKRRLPVWKKEFYADGTAQWL